MSRKRILVIAGSDSSGGAGLEADQKVIAAHGCYAMTATTALTAQNTTGVSGIHYTPPEFVKKQIDCCIDDIGVDVVKTGMLASAETVHVVADALRRHKVATSVVDPVMVATTGAQLLPKEAVKILTQELLPLTTVLTPNIPEAQLLASEAGKPFNEIRGLDDIKKLAEIISSLGPRYVLLKGGHLPLSKDKVVPAEDAEKNVVVDVLHGEGQTWVFESEYIKSKNTHGTGCSLASAIASNLACGRDVVRSVRAATQYVEAGIRTSSDLGKGSGPINHFHSTHTLPFAPGRFVEYILDREDVQPAWKEHTHHEFVKGLADGTLPMDAFKHYLIQDYHYLVHFSRANALAAYKAQNMVDINMSATIVTHIQTEMELHLEYCKEFGITREQVMAEEESQASIAYSRYILDIGASSDWFTLQLAFAPCLLGYGHIARRLYDDPATVRGLEANPFWKWIENYVADDYVEAVRIGSEILEKGALDLSPKKLEECVKVFVRATKCETAFWDMGTGKIR